MNLEEWTCAVKIAGSKKSKYLIAKIIKEQCLITPKKLYGAYQIDGKKVWDVLIKVEDLASTLQVCLDSGAKKVLLPITSAADLGTVPSDLVGAFSLIFYSSPEEAVYKALGVE